MKLHGQQVFLMVRDQRVVLTIMVNLKVEYKLVLGRKMMIMEK